MENIIANNNIIIINDVYNIIVTCIYFINHLYNFVLISVNVSYKCLGKRIIRVTVNDEIKRFEVFFIYITIQKIAFNNIIKLKGFINRLTP